MALLLIYVFAAGALGGLVNALIADSGLALPKKEKGDKFTILRPGFLGNIFIGGVSALISWGTYGPLAAINIVGKADGGETPISLSLTALAGAALVGVAGARWLTNEVDKKLLKAAASEAANNASDPKLSRAIAINSPVMTFRAVMGKYSDEKTTLKKK